MLGAMSSSAVLESDFGISSLMITPKRSRLSVFAVEMNTFLRLNKHLVDIDQVEIISKEDINNEVPVSSEALEAICESLRSINNNSNNKNNDSDTDDNHIDENSYEIEPEDNDEEKAVAYKFDEEAVESSDTCQFYEDETKEYELDEDQTNNDYEHNYNENYAGDIEIQPSAGENVITSLIHLSRF